MPNLRRVKQHWTRLMRGSPGRRFVERYKRAHRPRGRAGLAWRILRFGGGLVLLVFGLVEIVLPGPAVLFLFLGGALLATESYAVARLMDGSELLARGVWRRWRVFWRGRTRRTRTLVTAFLAGGGLATSYVLYQALAD